MTKEVQLAGFHAVNARVKVAPETVRVVYVDGARRDKRMQECQRRLKDSGVRVSYVGMDRLDSMAPNIPHQGIVAYAEALQTALTFDELLDSITEKTLLLILDGVTDPRNFGACLRVADAAGVQAVIAPKDRSASFSPAAAKAAAGAWETVPVVTVTNLAGAIMDLREAGVMVVGAAGESETTIYDIDQKRAFAWVLGAEGEGLRQLTRRRCERLAKIPMGGVVDSLNVSVATGICLFESVRQRHGASNASLKQSTSENL